MAKYRSELAALKRDLGVGCECQRIVPVRILNEDEDGVQRDARTGEIVGHAPKEKGEGGSPNCRLCGRRLPISFVIIGPCKPRPDQEEVRCGEA